MWATIALGARGTRPYFRKLVVLCAYLRITHLGYSACAAQAVVWALALLFCSLSVGLLAHYTFLLSLTVGYCAELLCSAGGVFGRVGSGVRWRFVLLSAGRDCGWL